VVDEMTAEHPVRIDATSVVRRNVRAGFIAYTNNSSG
jgi:hypothetical protein